MITKHIAQVEDDSNGFSPASLLTTVNGLELILQALRIVEPEAPEIELRRKLIETLEAAMPLCSEYMTVTPKGNSEVLDFNAAVARRQEEFQETCVQQLHNIGLVV
jgi:hypothetical protein